MSVIQIFDDNGFLLGEIDDNNIKNIQEASDEEIAEMLTKELTKEKLEEITRKWRFYNSNA